MLSLLAVLLVLAIPVGAVVAIVAAVRRHQEDDSAQPEDRGQTVRRLFQYAVLLGLLIVAAIGLTGLLTPLFETGETLTRSDASLARDLTFTFIGLPLFLALGRWTLTRLRTDPREVRSLGWTAYLTLATIISLLTAMTGLYGALTSLTGSGPLSGGSVATALVWTLVWALHQSLATRTTPDRRLRLVDLLGSLIGLGTAAVALVRLTAEALRQLFDLGGETIVVGTSTDGLLEAGALLLIGAVVWSHYWLSNLAPSRRDTSWLGYVLLAGVGAGLVAALAALTYLGFDVLVWLIGDTRGATAEQHFSGLPGLVGTAVVGTLGWWHHQAVLGAGRRHERTEVRRVYEYLMAGIGLVAAASGLTMVIVAIVEALAGDRDILVGVSTVNSLLAALTLLGVGVPVWWWHWRLAQRAAVADPVEEVTSPTRRIYLVLLFGVIGVVAVIALLTGVYLLLEDVLANGFSAETLRGTRFALGILVSAGIVSAYHWTVFRGDRASAQTVEALGTGSAAQPATPAQPGAPVSRGPRVEVPGHVLLVGPADPAIAREVADRVGGSVQLRRRLGDDVTPWSVEEVVAAIAAARASSDPDQPSELLVLSGPDGLQVIPLAPLEPPTGAPAQVSAPAR
ncbi:DUF5671 domain-containing protein [Ornithinimicrobium cryptoxanthini]|uniref:DUF5671 domain-containing protein n=1 Tax=Ornithinimicrobium cryptoxanthini TaxID=2934161 RepID=UPI0021173854|nr:DUF5671 domain-containing protein [Ornithinimicrobium cryptoxanthini]